VRAGAYWDAFRTDARFEGFWRTVSIRAAETIARLATAAADRLRAGAAGDLPTAEALLKLSETTLTYSTSAKAAAAPADPPAELQEGAQTKPEATAQQAPTRTAAAATPANLPADARAAKSETATRAQVQPYESRSAAAAASRDVARSFQSWIDTPMGQELAKSSNPKVVEFREAWRRLPDASLPTGPGPAAGPYGEVAVKARALVEAAVASGRFTRVDVMALRTLSAQAGAHAGRLAVTLPGTPSGGPAAAVTPRPQVPVPAPPTARGPRAGV
jgi:hypothetical protein